MEETPLKQTQQYQIKEESIMQDGFLTSSIFYAATIYLDGNYSGLAHGSVDVQEYFSGSLNILIDGVISNLRAELADQNPNANPDSWTITLTAFNRV